MILIEWLDTSFDTFAFILLQSTYNENIMLWVKFHSIFDL
jgi:hypothetical protein